MERLLTAIELAKHLSVDQNTIYTWARRGVIPKKYVVKIGPPGSNRAPIRFRQSWLEKTLK